MQKSGHLIRKNAQDNICNKPFIPKLTDLSKNDNYSSEIWNDNNSTETRNNNFYILLKYTMKITPLKSETATATTWWKHVTQLIYCNNTKLKTMLIQVRVNVTGFRQAHHGSPGRKLLRLTERLSFSHMFMHLNSKLVPCIFLKTVIYFYLTCKTLDSSSTQMQKIFFHLQQTLHSFLTELSKSDNYSTENYSIKKTFHWNTQEQLFWTLKYKMINFYWPIIPLKYKMINFHWPIIPLKYKMINFHWPIIPLKYKMTIILLK